MTIPAGSVYVEVGGKIDGLIDAMGETVESVDRMASQTTASMERAARGVASLATGIEELPVAVDDAVDKVSTRLTGLQYRFASTGVMVGFALEGMANGSESMSRRALRSIALLGFAFGPEGAIVSGIALSTQAVVDFFNRVEKEAKKTKEQLDSAFKDIGENGNLGAAEDKWNQIMNGDQFAQKKDWGALTDAIVNGGLSKLLQARADLSQQIEDVKSGKNTVIGQGAGQLGILNAVNDLEKGFRPIDVSIQSLREELDKYTPLIKQLQALNAAKGVDNSDVSGHGDNQLQQWQAEWQTRADVATTGGELLLREERDFWQSKIALTQSGTTEQLSVLTKVNGLTTRINDSRAKEDAAQKIAIEEADRSFWTYTLKQWEDGATALKASSSKRGIALLNDERMYWLERLVVADQYSADYATVVLRHLNELNTQIASANDEGVKKTREAWAALLTKGVEEHKQAAEKAERAWVGAFSNIESSITRTFEKARQNGTTSRALLLSVAHDVQTAFIEAEIKMANQALATWLVKKNITLEEVALHAWALATQAAREVAHVIASIVRVAAKAAAWAFGDSAEGGLPGLVAAPGVSLGVLAAVTSLAGGLPSAAGGWDIPAGLNPVTQLHGGEMVIPADIADRYRAGAPDGGDTHLHFYLPDPESFVQQNSATIARAALHGVHIKGVSVRGAAGKRP